MNREPDMNTKWAVQQIVAKDGTPFNVWRVLNPAGKTVWVTAHHNRAHTFAEFAPLIHAEYGTDTPIVPNLEAVNQ